MAEYTDDAHHIDWEGISRSMKAHRFDRTAAECENHWNSELSRQRAKPKGRNFSKEEDEALISLKTKYSGEAPQNIWEKISEGMRERKFNRPANSCQRRWDKLNHSEKQTWSEEANNRLMDLVSQGYSFKEISKQMKSYGVDRNENTCNKHYHALRKAKEKASRG